jgi:uracil permease
MKLVYDVHERPQFAKNLLYAFQQLLAVIAATILVPTLVNQFSGKELLNHGAAMIGAGMGTLVYLLFTRFKSPVFLGSSFAFISPLASAAIFGYWGILLGALIAGLVYVIIALVVRFVGTGWIDKLMPPVIIGPVVALIGLSLSTSAIGNLGTSLSGTSTGTLLAQLVGLLTFFITVVVSVKGGKSLRMIPFVIGVLGGYVAATIVTLIGGDSCKLIDFSAFSKIADFSNWIPNFTLAHAWDFDMANFATVFVAFAPVAFVVFAEHVADHKNISSIVNRDLLKDPGLDKTLLGDGVGSIVGALFGGCPNTTYGESVGCVAITRNASVFTTLTTAIMCIVFAFFYPVLAFIETIPTCVIGGICIALYGFIAVSGLRMFKHVDLEDSRNLFVVAAILVTGIGGLSVSFGKITITNVACALIVGIITNLLLNRGKKTEEEAE